MDWVEFSDGAMGVGKVVSIIVTILAGFVLTFKWVTINIILGLFPGMSLDQVHSEGEAFIALGFWMFVFITHLGLYAYSLGIATKYMPEIIEIVKSLIKEVRNARSRTD